MSYFEDKVKEERAQGKSAFLAGRTACKKKQTKQDCPFIRGTINRLYWMYGFYGKTMVGSKLV